MDTINYIIDFSTNFISTGGIVFAFFLVFIECLIPILPLSVFIALNVNAFGLFVGVLISWIATCLGSYVCYSFFYAIEKRVSKRIIGKRYLEKVNDKISHFKNISFTKLVLIITLPFTPSFFINLICGYTKISKEKYIIALLIGKVFSVTFWGYIGKTLIESLTDVKALIYVFITLIVAYVISKIINKVLNVE
ncbi:MAG: TVP38/TMEM64 family protein [Bacilli bacterium]|nr:TVP38/TMEM64 family protein [Bacilli bacterium]